MQPASVAQVISVNVGLPREVTWKGRRVRLLHRDEHQVKVTDITRLYHQDKHNLDLLRRVMAVEALPETWRDYFLQRLTRLIGSTSSSET